MCSLKIWTHVIWLDFHCNFLCEIVFSPTYTPCKYSIINWFYAILIEKTKNKTFGPILVTTGVNIFLNIQVLDCKKTRVED